MEPAILARRRTCMGSWMQRAGLLAIALALTLSCTGSDGKPAPDPVVRRTVSRSAPVTSGSSMVRPSEPLRALASSEPPRCSSQSEIREGPIARVEMRRDGARTIETFRGMQTAVYVAGSSEHVNAGAEDPNVLRRLTEVEAPPSSTVFLATGAGTTTVSSRDATGVLYSVRFVVHC